MTAYRFCRTDDMPLLADAYSRAFAPHFAAAPPLDVAGVKQLVRDVDLWCSSCMVASDDGGDPIGVLLGAKRPAETLIVALGIAPDHLRRGHGRHLLTSLSSKLAILGPPALVAEIPDDDARAAACFEACGYEPGVHMRDFELDPRRNPACLRADAFAPVTLDELLANDALAAGAPRPWTREVSALRRRTDVQGLALVSPDRIEGWLLWGQVWLLAFPGPTARPGPAPRVILGLGGDCPPALMELLLGHFAAQADTPVVFPRVREDELSWSYLEELGFRPGRTYRRYTARARAA